MRWKLFLAALGLVLVACSEGEGPDIAVRAFSEVQASEFSFEADPTNLSRGIFRVTTSEPMICAIVWGEDESLGNFNNSLDMAGTGIVQHDVFLPGAEAGVEYHFVVQGTTADGTLYRSEPGTFTIPVISTAGEDTDGRPNLALGATIVEVSSEFSSGFAAGNAVDGDGATEWSSAGDGDGAYITIDLGKPSDVSGFAFLTRSMTDGSSITETYVVTVDNEESLGPFDAGTPVDRNIAEVDLTGQVFRFDVETSTGGNTGAVEVEVLGSSG